MMLESSILHNNGRDIRVALEKTGKKEKLYAAYVHMRIS